MIENWEEMSLREALDHCCKLPDDALTFFFLRDGINFKYARKADLFSVNNKKDVCNLAYWVLNQADVYSAFIGASRKVPKTIFLQFLFIWLIVNRGLFKFNRCKESTRIIDEMMFHIKNLPLSEFDKLYTDVTTYYTYYNEFYKREEK